MADKEATVYIVDLGSSMGDCHNGRTESDLDWSMQYVWDRISTTVAASRKTWNVGVLGFRTTKTDNPLQENDGYENISVLQDLGPLDMSAMKSLKTKIQPNQQETGDAISAIVLAIQMIQELTKKLKYSRRIVLVTNGEAPFDADDFHDISTKMKQCGISLSILGVDFDDVEFGFKEEDKTESKAKNERLLKDLAVKCDGSFGTVAQAVAELYIPRLKSFKPYKSYDGSLTIGDPDSDKRTVSISVERYFKTHKMSPPSASNVVTKSDEAMGTQSTHTLDGDEMEGVEFTSGSFASVKNKRGYRVNDPDGPGGRKYVDFESLAKGYEYGRTAVYISESEFNVTKLETKQSFTIIGSIPMNMHQPFMNMGDCHMILAQKKDDASALKLSSLIHSLHELELYAVARLVAKDNKEPQLLLLAPYIEPQWECLYDVPLPFAEDVRGYQFPPLDKVVTVTDKVLTKHRYLPSQDLMETMSEYVDAMDISTFGLDDDGQRTLEYAPIDDVFSPPVHRINQVVRHRAIYPDEPVPPIKPILFKYAQPHQDLVAQAKSRLDELIEIADVKKVPSKNIRVKRQHDAPKPISGLDVDALLQAPENKRREIDPKNAIPEFKQILASADDEATSDPAVVPPSFKEAAEAMGQVIRQLITDSFADSNYNRAIEHMGVFRDEMINYEQPDLYDAFVRDLKRGLVAEELGKNRLELWWTIKGAKLGLIDNRAYENSKVTAEQAEEFYKLK